MSWSARGDGGGGGDGLMGGDDRSTSSSSVSVVSWSVVAAAAGASGWRWYDDDDRQADGKEKREKERRLCSTADAEEALRVIPEERWRRGVGTRDGRPLEEDSTAIATMTAFIATNHHHAVVMLRSLSR